MTHGDLQDEDDEGNEFPDFLAAREVFRPSVEFSHRTSPHIKEKNKQAILRRAAVLFDPSLYAPSLLTTLFRTPPPETFKIVPSEFLRRAQSLPPREPQATASAFAQWIYSLYAKAYGDDEDRERGKEMEEYIFERRRFSACCVDNAYLRSTGSDWRLVHNGLHTHDKEYINYFNIMHLMVGSSPLKVSPDLIYQNWRTLEVIIVEIKYSRLPITTNLWPNVWGQLWCYSQIDLALNAPKVTVIGEVWGEWWTRGRRGRGCYDPGVPILSLRASVRRDPRASAYDRFFRKLFDIYRGA